MGLKSKNLTKQSYRKLLQQSIDTGVPFTDQEFRAGDSSLFSDRQFLSELGVSRVVWKRPLELVRDPHLLFREKIGSNSELEIPVGKGPNDSFLAAAASVATDKSLVYRTFYGQLVPKDQHYFVRGIFKVFLWNWGHWIKLVIDDKLPSDGEQLVFSSSKCGTVFWMPLLEKAMAKLFGSYELYFKNCSVASAFYHLTGHPVEIVDFDSQSEQNMFRLMAEELEKGSLLCLLSQTEVSTSAPNVCPNSYYLLSSLTKPNLSSFRKKVTTGSAVINLIATKWESEDRQSDNRRKDVWLKVDQFSTCLKSLIICHLKKKFSSIFATSDSQLIFDVNNKMSELMVEVSQQKLHGLDDIWLVIHRVEVNRRFKLSHPGHGVFHTDPETSRTVFCRVNLKNGRYILQLKSSRETNFMVRANTADLREADNSVSARDWSPKILSKTPSFVTRVLVYRALNLEKPNHVSSLSPYCRLSVGGEHVRTPVHKNTCNPDFDGFGCIFYHTKLKDLVLEVTSHGLLKDIPVGVLSVPLELGSKAETRTLDLKSNSGSVSGSIELLIETYDDVTQI